MRFIVTGMSATLTSLLCQLIDKFGFDIDISPVGEYHRVRVLLECIKSYATDSIFTNNIMHMYV